MKKSIFIAAIFSAFAVISCKKTETTAADVNADPDDEVVVVDNDSLPITNDSTVDRIDDGVENTIDNTGDAIREGANEVGDAASDATDGDGDITK